MNFHAKSGVCSSKNGCVMSIYVLFYFCNLFGISIQQGAQLGSDCCFTRNLCKISWYDRRGIFGGLRRWESYSECGELWAWSPCENPKSLSSPKAEKFDFLRFWRCQGFRGGVSGEFLGYHRCGEYSEWGEQMGLRSFWIQKVSIKSQSEKIDFLKIFLAV